MVEKISQIGLTTLMHWPDPNNRDSCLKISGTSKEVFEKLGMGIINSSSNCSEEIFKILKLKLEKYSDEKLKRQLVDFVKKIIVDNKLDLSDELHELMSFHYSLLDWRGQGEMILRYLGKDTKFVFRPLVKKEN